MSKAKAQKARKTRPSLRRPRRLTVPPRAEAERTRPSEAPTMPPPPPGEAEAQPKVSARVKKGLAAVTVDVVTADLSKDKRREE
jgi:hypothetical protein